MSRTLDRRPDQPRHPVKQLPQPTVHCMLKSRQLTEAVSDKLVSIVEHLAAKELNISLRSWWRSKTEVKEYYQDMLTLHNTRVFKGLLVNTITRGRV